APISSRITRKPATNEPARLPPFRLRCAILLLTVLPGMNQRAWKIRRPSHFSIVSGRDRHRAVPGRKLNLRSDLVESGKQPRYLGLDVGNRRIGVAVSDELGLTAQPVLTLERRSSGGPGRREDLRSLARLCRRFGVAGIVVGNPLHLSGETSPQAARTQAFAVELGELTGIPI